MARYRKILVAIDGSDASMHALAESFKLAAYEKCWITVVSVVPPYEGELELVGVGNIREAIRQPCERALSQAMSLAKGRGALIKPVCEEGEPFERIVDLAEAENCDLIVTGRTGRGGFKKALIGNVAARVIGYSQRDVLVIPLGATLGWKRILFPTDGSRFSSFAGARAIDFAQSYGGELKVVNVIDVPPEFYAEASTKVVDDMIQRAQRQVNEVKRQAEASEIAVETFIREDREAYDAITDLAVKQDIDVIVMGSHGRTGLRRLLMGSVAEKVLGNAPCPVLVVKS